MQTAAKLGFIWQGRYTLPVGVGLPIVAAWVVADRLRPSALLRVAAVILAVGVAVGNLAGWATMMSRYHSGASAPITSFFRWSNTWHAPLGNVTFTALLGVALVGLTVVLVGASRWRPVTGEAPLAGRERSSPATTT
jgi:hypothetical protein